MKTYKISEVKEKGMWVKCESKTESLILKRAFKYSDITSSEIGYYRFNDADCAKYDYRLFEFPPKEFILFSKIDFEEKEIVGYKTPMKLFGESLPVGELYVRGLVNDVASANYYVPKRLQVRASSTQQQMIPKEIVEQWEPVYKEDKIIVGGEEVEFIHSCVKIKGKHFSKEGFEVIQQLLDHPDKDIINKIINRLK